MPPPPPEEQQQLVQFIQKQAKLLVEAYNDSHENQVELTVVPNDDYVAKVGAAAGSVAGSVKDKFSGNGDNSSSSSSDAPLGEQHHTRMPTD